MQAGNVPTAVVGPVIAQLIEERFPDEDGCKVLAEEVGCDPETVRKLVGQRYLGVGFDLVDRILAKLGRPDLWEGCLAEFYPETFWVTCALPACHKQFQEKMTGGQRKLCCSKRCSTLYQSMRRGEATGLRLRQRGYCLKGHKLTEDNTRTDKRGQRHCLTCQRDYQRLWAREHRKDPRFRLKRIAAQRRWRERQAVHAA